MSIVHIRPAVGVAALAAAVAVLASCSGKGDKSSGMSGGSTGGLLGSANDGAATQDPCTLLAASEAEPYVGALATPPYRAGDESGAANAAGDECMYRGKDGRELTVTPQFGGGKMMTNVLRGVPNGMGRLLGQGGAGGMSTEVHKIMQQGPAGPWDQATWMPTGTLFVTKGDAQVMINVVGASGQQNDAVAVAQKVMPRLGHPLDYDGAKAAAVVPKPKPHPANACDLVSRPEIEAAIGPLDGAPTPDSAGTSCTYKVTGADGTQTYPVEFLWQGGQQNYNMLKHGMSMLSGIMGTPSSTPLDTMKPDTTMQKMIGGLMKMVGGGDKSAAPAAASKIGFQTDTTLQGPWDNASLLHGTQLIAVRHDVFVGMTLESADYEKAKALMRAICAKL